MLQQQRLGNATTNPIKVPVTTNAPVTTSAPAASVAPATTTARPAQSGPAGGQPEASGPATTSAPARPETTKPTVTTPAVTTPAEKPVAAASPAATTTSPSTTRPAKVIIIPPPVLIPVPVVAEDPTPIAPPTSVSIPATTVAPAVVPTTTVATGPAAVPVEVLPAADQTGRTVQTAQMLIDAVLASQPVTFVGKSAVLTSSARTSLTKIAALLKANPDLSIVISAYVDNSGSSAQRIRLTGAQSRAVADYLVVRGIAAKRLRWNGYGSAKPIGNNGSAAGRALNNRIEIKVR